MSKISSKARIVIIIMAAVFGAASYFFLGHEPQSAQKVDDSDAIGTKRTARFADYARLDSTTNYIRSKSRNLVRIEIKTEADRQALTRYGSVVQDFGSSAIVSVEKSAVRQVQKLGATVLDQTLNLPGAKFDPIKSPPPQTVDVDRLAGSVEKDYYVVQLGGVPTDEWLDSLRDAGLEILQYVPNHAFFVYADGETISKVAGHSRVRWVGSYEPQHKIPYVLKEQLSAELHGTALRRSISRIEKSGDDTAVFDVAVFAREPLEVAAKRIFVTTGGNIRNLISLPNNFFNVVRIELPLYRVEDLAIVPGVIRIDSWQRPAKEDERSAQIVAGNYSSQTTIAPPGYDPLFQFGVDGRNVTVSVVDDGVGIPGDGGFYLTEQNTVNAPLRGAPSGAKGHGHLNASIIAGNSPFSTLDPAGYNYGRGIAPSANIISIPLLRQEYTGTEANVYNDTVTTVGPNGVLGTISNNSWGNGTNSNVYDSYAAQFDGYVRDASIGPGFDPLTIIFSAGNNGPSGLSLTRPKVAKNIIAVGNTENLRTEIWGPSNNIDDLETTSSRGNTADGRIKPDIVAPGTAIAGGRSGPDTLFGNIDAAHRWSTGTSHAAPHIAGAAALFTEHWKIVSPGRTPSPALIKAAILNSGQEMSGANTNGATVPNGNEGWGRINMRYVIDNAALIYRVDQSVAFSTVGNSYTINGSVNDPSRPVRVSLAWTDPPAVTDPALVNNLDLSVTIGNNTYRGNVFSGGVSIPGGSFDNKNNVENVWLPAGLPTGTPFSVTVTASALNGDGILGNPDTTDQHFALVAYNFSESAPSLFFSISGVVQSASGRGVSGAIVFINDLLGNSYRAITNPFGYYRFDNIVGGRQYTATVVSKRHTFSSQTFQLDNNLADVNFIASDGP